MNEIGGQHEDGVQFGVHAVSCSSAWSSNVIREGCCSICGGNRFEFHATPSSSAALSVAAAGDQEWGQSLGLPKG